MSGHSAFRVHCSTPRAILAVPAAMPLAGILSPPLEHSASWPTRRRTAAEESALSLSLLPPALVAPSARFMPRNRYSSITVSAPAPSGSVASRSVASLAPLAPLAFLPSSLSEPKEVTGERWRSWQDQGLGC